MVLADALVEDIFVIHQDRTAGPHEDRAIATDQTTQLRADHDAETIEVVDAQIIVAIRADVAEDFLEVVVADARRDLEVPVAVQAERIEDLDVEGVGVNAQGRGFAIGDRRRAGIDAGC